MEAANTAVSGGATDPHLTAKSGGGAKTLPKHTIRSFKDFSYADAYMLATLPRKKWDEYTLFALGGMLASLPFAAHDLLEALETVDAKGHFNLQLFPALEIGVFLIFTTWFLVKRGVASQQQTASEYLEALRTGASTAIDGGSGYKPPAAKKKWWQWK